MVCLFNLLPALAADKEEGCSRECQASLVQSYFERLSKVYQAGSSEEDLNVFFELMHDSVKYEHIQYGANFNKSSWVEAFHRNFKRGAYKKAANEKMKVLKFIHGKSHVAVEYAYGSTDEKGNWTEAETGPGLLAVFGFQDSKITLIREYW